MLMTVESKQIVFKGFDSFFPRGDFQAVDLSSEKKSVEDSLEAKLRRKFLFCCRPRRKNFFPGKIVFEKKSSATVFLLLELVRYFFKLTSS